MAIATPRHIRPLVVSGYQVQIAVLQLCAKSIYPAWDNLMIYMGFKDKLYRFRFHMSICTFFCIFGFLYMLFRGGAMLKYKPLTKNAKKEDGRDKPGLTREAWTRVRAVAKILR